MQMYFFRALPQWAHLHQMFLRSLELPSVRPCWFWRPASAHTSCINSELARLLCTQEPICLSDSFIVLQVLSHPPDGLSASRPRG